MIELDRKYLALLDEADRRGRIGAEPLRLCFEVLALGAAIERSCALRLAPHRLSESKFVLLLLLLDASDGLAPFALAERAGVTRATITGLLDGLERDGFVARHADPEDRRRISVRLTEQGQSKARDLIDEHTRWIASLFAGFDEGERRVLSTLLGRAWRNVDGDAKGAALLTASAP